MGLWKIDNVTSEEWHNRQMRLHSIKMWALTILEIALIIGFLVGRIPYSFEFRWSRSAYDAWGTREKERAKKVARLTGGEIWLFNPVTGQLREAKI